MALAPALLPGPLVVENEIDGRCLGFHGLRKKAEEADRLEQTFEKKLVLWEEAMAELRRVHLNQVEGAFDIFDTTQEIREEISSSYKKDTFEDIVETLYSTARAALDLTDGLKGSSRMGAWKRACAYISVLDKWASDAAHGKDPRVLLCMAKASLMSNHPFAAKEFAEEAKEVLMSTTVMKQAQRSMVKDTEAVLNLSTNGLKIDKLNTTSGTGEHLTVALSLDKAKLVKLNGAGWSCFANQEDVARVINSPSGKVLYNVGEGSDKKLGTQIVKELAKAESPASGDKTISRCKYLCSLLQTKEETRRTLFQYNEVQGEINKPFQLRVGFGHHLKIGSWNIRAGNARNFTRMQEGRSGRPLGGAMIDRLRLEEKLRNLETMAEARQWSLIALQECPNAKLLKSAGSHSIKVLLGKFSKTDSYFGSWDFIELETGKDSETAGFLFNPQVLKPANELKPCQSPFPQQTGEEDSDGLVLDGFTRPPVLAVFKSATCPRPCPTPQTFLDDGSTLVVCNVHLKSAEGGNARTRFEARLLASEQVMKEIEKTGADHALIIGDLNLSFIRNNFAADHTSCLDAWDGNGTMPGLLSSDCPGGKWDLALKEGQTTSFGPPITLNQPSPYDNALFRSSDTKARQVDSRVHKEAAEDLVDEIKGIISSCQEKAMSKDVINIISELRTRLQTAVFEAWSDHYPISVTLERQD